MKKSIFNFSMSLIITILLGIIISLILAILKKNNIINSNICEICIISLSIIVFFILGFIFSFKQKKRGLLNGLVLIALYFIIYFIVNSLMENTTPIYLTICRPVAIMFGSLFGVNLSSKNDQKD